MDKNQKEKKWNYRSIVGIALLSLLICGLLYPLLITGLAQVLFPNQANGEIVMRNGEPVGSYLISQNFTLPRFFHPRNDSASGVDPDITLEDAYSQILRIHDSTNISPEELRQIVDSDVEGDYWIFGNPYVNVLKLNLALIEKYPDIYG